MWRWYRSRRYYLRLLGHGILWWRYINNKVYLIIWSEYTSKHAWSHTRTYARITCTHGWTSSLPWQHYCRFFSLGPTWPYHERRFWVTSFLNFWFLILSFRVLPWIHLSIFVSVVCILCCSALCSAQHSLPYIKVGLMTALYSLFFNLTGTF